MEIGADGAVTVHDRPEVIAGGARVAITLPTTRRTVRSRHRLRGVGTSTSVEPLNSAAALYDLSPDLIEAVAWRESRRRHGVISPKGAVGEMQLMPGTARALGVDPFNSAQNLTGGAAYLRRLLHRYDGDVVRALAAYNAGPGAVDRYSGVPPYKETRDYVAAILDHMSVHAVGAAVPAKR